jgi:hypothetical protein
MLEYLILTMDAKIKSGYKGSINQLRKKKIQNLNRGVQVQHVLFNKYIRNLSSLDLPGASLETYF